MVAKVNSQSVPKARENNTLLQEFPSFLSHRQIQGKRKKMEELILVSRNVTTELHLDCRIVMGPVRNECEMRKGRR